MANSVGSNRESHEHMRREVWIRSVEACLRNDKSANFAAMSAKEVLERFDREFPENINETLDNQ